MTRDEKVRLSADREWSHCFKQGMFTRFFEHGLYCFSHTIKPLKPMVERVKGGDPIVYGGLPVSSLESLLELLAKRKPLRLEQMLEKLQPGFQGFY